MFLFSKIALLTGMILCSNLLSAQLDSLRSKLEIRGDFRFRAEQDWDSRKSDDTYRTDRFRFRYRVRLGAKYAISPSSTVGVRMRTGNPGKQQDPQLTLGAGSKEFGTLSVALDRAYYQFQKADWTLWFGKNDFPFEKQNELFWSDNVNPEGVFIKKSWPINTFIFRNITFSAGHFIVQTRSRSLDQDGYFQGLQIQMQDKFGLFTFFPGLFLFRNIQNVPDGAETFLMDYTIVHAGMRYKTGHSKPLSFEFDIHKNLEDYESNLLINEIFRDQTIGYEIAVGYGSLKTPGDWMIKVTFAHIEKFAAVDFLAQNDWARWDYSAYDSPDGRLTNFQGGELVLGFKLSENISLKSKVYLVRALQKQGLALETNKRVRVDLDIKF